MGMCKLRPPLSKEKFETIYTSGGWIEVFKKSDMWNGSFRKKKRLLFKLLGELELLRIKKKHQHI